MRIRVIIEDTEPMAEEGTYIMVQPLGSGPVDEVLRHIEDYILRSLRELRVLTVGKQS